MKQEFSENVKRFRMMKKLTQQELAERVGVNKSIISAYENQQRLPSIDMLVKLSYEFNVSMEVLLGISKNKTLDVSKLNENQIALLMQVVKEFENK